jgi:hypothetical protein
MWSKRILNHKRNSLCASFWENGSLIVKKLAVGNICMFSNGYSNSNQNQ